MKLIYGTTNAGKLTVMDERHIYESMESLWSEPFLLICVPHTQR